MSEGEEIEKELKRAYAACIGKQVLVQFRGNVQLAMASRDGSPQPAVMVQAEKEGQKEGAEEEPVVVPVPAVPMMVGTLEVVGQMLQIEYGFYNPLTGSTDKAFKIVNPADVVGVDRVETTRIATP